MNRHDNYRLKYLNVIDKVKTLFISIYNKQKYIFLNDIYVLCIDRY